MLKPLMELADLITSPIKRVVKIPPLSVNPRTGRITVRKTTSASETQRIEAVREPDPATVAGQTAMATYPISGKVNKGNNQAFEGVEIAVFGHDENDSITAMSVRGQTNQNGNFQLRIPENVPKVSLIFSYPGTVTQEIEVHKEKAGEQILVTLLKA